LTNWETVSFLRVNRLHEVSYYHHVIVLMLVPKISSISTENLPQGTTPCLFKADVAENLPQGMTPFLPTAGVYAAFTCLKMLWNM
jgi:hypothetical protein